jgi:hypothetical protein
MENTPQLFPTLSRDALVPFYAFGDFREIHRRHVASGGTVSAQAVADFLAGRSEECKEGDALLKIANELIQARLQAEIQKVERKRQMLLTAASV